MTNIYILIENHENKKFIFNVRVSIRYNKSPLVDWNQTSHARKGEKIYILVFLSLPTQKNIPLFVENFPLFFVLKCYNFFPI